MKRVGVITESNIVYNKIRLLLRGIAEVERISDNSAAYSTVFLDTDSVGSSHPGAITLGAGGDIPLPFRHEDIIDAVMKASDEPVNVLTLSTDGKHVCLCGEKIKLTEVEYKLLECLINADGFISRENLLGSVWGEGFDSGVVNVYVCYLRRKLEKDGKKIIISSRNEGYRIDEKYRRDK